MDDINFIKRTKILNRVEEDFTMVSSNNWTITAYTQPIVRTIGKLSTFKYLKSI